MASLNLCQFIGNIGKKDVRYLPDGKAVCNISLAVNDSYKNKDGEKVEQTEWVRVSMFGKLAEIAEKYTNVGGSIYVACKMRTRKYQKDGVDHYSTEFIADQMQMLGGKPSGDTPRSEPKQQAKGGGGNDNSGFGDMSDDCPFLSCAYADEPILRKLRRA